MPSLRFKYLLLYLFFLSMFLLLAVRYFQIQVLMDDKPFKRLLKKFNTERVIKFPGWRGAIYTEDGIPLALSLNSFVFFALTNRLDDTDIELLAKEFGPVFGIPPSKLLKKLQSKEGYVKIYETTDWEVWEKYKKRRKEIIHKVITLAKEVIGIRTYDEDKIREYYQKTKSPKLALALHYLHVLKWFGYTKAYKRFYPQGRYLANTVGFVSSNGTGRAGIELMENKYLYKGPIEIPYIRGLRGLKIIDLPIASKVKNLFVGDVYLTIDGTIQAILERVKNEIVQRWNPKKVVLILMDIHTGEIKGLAVYPDFDPNKPFRNWQEFLNSRNPAFMDVFEMGSVIKPFFVGMALYKGYIKPDDKIYIDHGKVRVGRHWVRDAERLPKQYLTPAEVLIHSSNVGTVQIAKKLTLEDVKDLIETLKWNKVISNFPGSTAGLIPPLKYPANRLYIAFGHGLALTPIHLVTSYAALLTGYAPKPLLVKRVVREDGKILYEAKPSYLNPNRPLFDEKTRSWLKKVLHLIVLEGTGKKANPYYYKVGGKTGTAAIYDKKLRRYSKTKYVTSFIGYFPYNNPKYVLLVLVDQPQAPRRYLLYGGTVAAPYWREIVNEVSSYLGIKPDFSSS